MNQGGLGRDPTAFIKPWKHFDGEEEEDDSNIFCLPGMPSSPSHPPLSCVEQGVEGIITM